MIDDLFHLQREMDKEKWHGYWGSSEGYIGYFRDKLLNLELNLLSSDCQMVKNVARNFKHDWND